MLQKRGRAACILLGDQDDTLFMVGGTNREKYVFVLAGDTTFYAIVHLNFSSHEPLKTTEFVKTDLSTRGPDLPVPMMQHCFVKVDSNLALLIGGETTEKSVLNNVWYYDIQAQAFTPGPPMSSPRRSHACALIQDTVTSEALVVCAGGFSTKSYQSR